MAVNLIDPFNGQMPFPFDLRMVKANISDRDNIPQNARYDGMAVWTRAERKLWRLVGGVDDGDWVDQTPIGLDGRMFTYTTSGDGTTREFSVPHGLGYTPTMVLVTANSTDALTVDLAAGSSALGSFWARIDGSDIIISYIGVLGIGGAPRAGTNNLTWTIFVK